MTTKTTPSNLRCRNEASQWKRYSNRQRRIPFALRDAPVFLLRIDEHAISPFVPTNRLHSAKPKQINAVQTPTPNAERHSDRAMRESNHA